MFDFDSFYNNIEIMMNQRADIPVMTTPIVKPDALPVKQPVWSYADVLNNIDIGVLVLDHQLKSVAFRNPALHDILGDRSAPFGYASLLKFFPSADVTDYVADRPSTIQYNKRLLGFSIYPVSAKHTCVFIRDITEKARLESIAQAVNTMDNLGFIFSGIRHEIGNPLNSIKMTISVLRNNLDNFSKETISEYVERTYAEILRMEYLLKSLKSFSMFERIDARRHSFKSFLEKFVSLIHRDLEAQNIQLMVQPIVEDLIVLIDPQALHQAMLNLITNAAESLGDRPAGKITIRTRCDGSLAWLSVEDNGCGMSQDQLKHLFQPFCTSKPQGNGLGLVITQKLLAKMNASIDILSQEGIGTKVNIALPLADYDKSPHQDAGKTQEKA